MAAPETGVTIQRPDLGALAWEHLGDAASNGFIADQVLPDFPVAQKNSNFPIIPREVLLKLPDTKRGMRGAYGRADWAFNQDNYDCDEYGWEEVMDDAESALYARFFDAEAVATIRATNILMRDREKRVADGVFNSTTFTPVAVGTEWDTVATADPLGDVDAGKIVIRNKTGLRPNTLIISYTTLLDLGKNAKVLDRIKYTTNANVVPGELPVSLLATYFGVNQVLVGDSIFDATKKGKSMATATDIWDKEFAMLCVIAGGADLTSPSMGRTFRWTGDSPSILNTEQYRENSVRGDVFRVRNNVDEKIISTDVCHLMSNIHT